LISDNCICGENRDNIKLVKHVRLNDFGSVHSAQSVHSAHFCWLACLVALASGKH